MTLGEMAKVVHENAKSHGWWEEERKIPEVLALIHSEWSEALEEYRAARPMIWHKCNEAPEGELSFCEPADAYDCVYYGKEATCPHYDPKPEGIAVELIDGCIRILDLFGLMNIQIEGPSTIEKLIKQAPIMCYEMEVPELVCYLHFYTSKAMNYDGDPDLVRGWKGICGELLKAMSIVFCWLNIKGVDVEKVMMEKHAYNVTRPYKHGNKVC